MLSANKDSFISSLPTYMPLIYFSGIIVLPKISNIMSNRNGNSSHPWHGPDFWVNTFHVLPLNMVLT